MARCTNVHLRSLAGTAVLVSLTGLTRSSGVAVADQAKGLLATPIADFSEGKEREQEKKILEREKKLGCFKKKKILEQMSTTKTRIPM